MNSICMLNDLRKAHSDLRTAIQTRNDGEGLDFNRILDELPQVGGGQFTKYATATAELLKQKVTGELMDDRQLLVGRNYQFMSLNHYIVLCWLCKCDVTDSQVVKIERVIRLIAKLPETSVARQKVTGVLVEKLWDSLQHPPMDYLGEDYKYRHPDGSFNNITSPNLGKAGTPYARTVRTEIQVKGAQPDPGLLFDLLMARGDSFEPNEAGISIMLMYHASLITHDIFNTNRVDANINDHSSYLDLSPLYGSKLEHQRGIRTYIGGALKPDTFHEKRLLAFPPGTNVLLVMYNRFHNYVARNLAAINEGGRFTPPRHLHLEAAQSWKDEQLFQVARLVTNGLYINISLHDYLRAIANVPTTDSTWTMDPRVAIQKPTKSAVPRGVGNHVSCEFNLLYRFHSAISKRDEEWTKTLYGEVFPNQNPRDISVPTLLQGLTQFEKSIPDDPSQRTFAGLIRKPCGSFEDEDLVKIIKESIEDPAGRFGAHHVPDVMKAIEILGITQGRKWKCAPLNEFRKFFELRPYKKFEELNPDPYVAQTLKNLYGDIDQVELYPGMFLEATKPKMEAGMGLCAPYSVTRAVFSDAITLVRGDRYLTLDYTPSNLTNWGITEVASDYKTLGGAKMHHLILTAFPKYFQFNSVYAMQPFYTPEENRKIFDKLGTSHLFSYDPPTASPPLIPISSHAGLQAILTDNKNFRVPWGAKMAALEGYMLASDTPANAAQRQIVKEALYGSGDRYTLALQNFEAYSKQVTLGLLDEKSFQLGLSGPYQVDIVADISNLAALRFASELCYLPLNAKNGPSYTEDQLFKILCDITTYTFSDADPTRSWARRRDSYEGTEKLCADMEVIVKSLLLETPRSPHSTSDFHAATKAIGNCILNQCPIKLTQCPIKLPEKPTDAEAQSPSELLSEYGANFARKLLSSGRSIKEVALILVGTASAFVANTTTAFVQLIDFYLDESRAQHWAEIQCLAAESTSAADEILTKYCLEGFRLSNALGLVRIAAPQGQTTVSIKEHGVDCTFKKGDRLFINIALASRDADAFPEPDKIKLDRPKEKYVTFGEGPHQCLGKDINLVHSRALLKVLAGLPKFRRSPGDEGRLKSLPRPGGLKVYMTPEWNRFSPYPTTMKVQWDDASCAN